MVKPLYRSIEKALLSKQIHGFVLALPESRPPFTGLIEWMDIRLGREFSRHILKTGKITGQAGECVYIPLHRHSQTWHFILAGMGSSESLPAETLRNLQKNLTHLKLPTMGASCSDLGAKNPDALEKNLKGVSLWITD